MHKRGNFFLAEAVAIRPQFPRMSDTRGGEFWGSGAGRLFRPIGLGSHFSSVYPPIQENGPAAAGPYCLSLAAGNLAHLAVGAWPT